MHTLDRERISDRMKTEARFAGIVSLIGIGVMLGLCDRAKENVGRIVKRWSGRGKTTH